MIRAIVFDLWGTLGSSKTSISKDFKHHFKLHHVTAWQRRYERAVLMKKWDSEEDMARAFLKEFELSEDEDNITYVVQLMQRKLAEAELYDGMQHLLERLENHYSLAILSNTSNFSQGLTARWGINRLLDAELHSWHLGVLKPHLGSYAAVCEKLQMAPQECIFVDDNQENVDAASEYGMEGIHFTGVEKLHQELDVLLK